MPQIDQLPDIFWSQLFWLAIVFGIIFFVIGRGMLPKIEATVDARDAKIADDLAGGRARSRRGRRDRGGLSRPHGCEPGRGAARDAGLQGRDAAARPRAA